MRGYAKPVEMKWKCGNGHPDSIGCARQASHLRSADELERLIAPLTGAGIICKLNDRVRKRLQAL